VVPALYSVTDATAAAVADAVAKGATAFVTFFSGIVDENDRVRLGGYPGAFRGLLGVLVEEFSPVPADVTMALTSGGKARLWTEYVRAEGAEVIDRFEDGPVAGSPVVTRNQVGSGAAWYAASALEPDTLAALMSRVVEDSGVIPMPAAGPKVEVVRRVGVDASYLFVINHSLKDVSVDVSGMELVQRREVTGDLTVPAGTARVVREETA